MNSSLLSSVVTLAIYICTMVIIVTVLSTGVFETIYVRQVPIKGSDQNGSARGDEDVWPAKMKLRMSNFHCNIPSPNLDLTNDQLADAWKLPPQTRLSPTMRDIARCQLTAKWIRMNKGELHDDRKCICVEIWWLLMVFSMAVAAFVFYSLFFYRSPPIAELDKLYAGRCCSGTWFFIWYLILCMSSMRSHDAGISYTPYGSMNQHAYYKEPIQWFVIFVVCLIICFLEGIKFLIFGTAINKFKRQVVESRANDQSPPAYNQVVSFETMSGKAVPL